MACDRHAARHSRTIRRSVNYSKMTAFDPEPRGDSDRNVNWRLPNDVTTPVYDRPRNQRCVRGSAASRSSHTQSPQPRCHRMRAACRLPPPPVLRGMGTESCEVVHHVVGRRQRLSLACGCSRRVALREVRGSAERLEESVCLSGGQRTQRHLVRLSHSGRVAVGLPIASSNDSYRASDVKRRTKEEQRPQQQLGLLVLLRLFYCVRAVI